MGILGGTFNPPHLGHVALARHALAELGLERVVVMPAHSAPHKLDGADPGPAHRLRMCELAVRDEAAVAACAMEIERGGPSYTVDTLRAIHASHPDLQLTFIVGADTARTLPTWREPRELLELADLGVAEREGSGSGGPGPETDGREGVVGVIAGLDAKARVTFLTMPQVAVSSSEVRARVEKGMPVGELVGEAVAAYIAEQRLYRANARPATLGSNEAKT